MLTLAIAFGVIAVIAALLGFRGAAFVAAGIARAFLLVFLVLFILFLILAIA